MSERKMFLLSPEEEAKMHTKGMSHLVHINATVRRTDDAGVESEVEFDGAARVDEEFYRRIKDLADDVVSSLTEPLTADDICNLERDELDYFTDKRIIDQIKKKVQIKNPEFNFDEEGCDYDFRYTIPIFRLMKTSGA